MVIPIGAVFGRAFCDVETSGSLVSSVAAFSACRAPPDISSALSAVPRRRVDGPCASPDVSDGLAATGIVAFDSVSPPGGTCPAGDGIVASAEPPLAAALLTAGDGSSDALGAAATCLGAGHGGSLGDLRHVRRRRWLLQPRLTFARQRPDACSGDRNAVDQGLRWPARRRSRL